MLELTKPLIFFDLETTGANPASDRIIEIALIKINIDGSRESRSWRVNPGMPIPKSSTDIHHITDEDVKDCPDFKTLAPQILEFIGNADLGGYNSTRFDVPVLIEECIRNGFDFDLKNRKLVDAQHIFYMMEPRTLTAAYKFYCGKKLEGAHSAETDVQATLDVFLAQVEKYKDVEIENKKGETVKPIHANINTLSYHISDNQSVDLVGRIVMNEHGIEVFNFGKYKDKPVHEVFKKEPAYYHWMMKGDFTHYTKKIITQIMLKGKEK